MIMKFRDVKIQQLAEDFRGSDDKKAGCRFGDWVELCRQSDDNLLFWLFGDDDEEANLFLGEAEMEAKYKAQYDEFIAYCNTLDFTD